jgi:hypothetical protein
MTLSYGDGVPVAQMTPEQLEQLHSHVVEVNQLNRDLLAIIGYLLDR